MNKLLTSLITVLSISVFLPISGLFINNSNLLFNCKDVRNTAKQKYDSLSFSTETQSLTHVFTSFEPQQPTEIGLNEIPPMTPMSSTTKYTEPVTVPESTHHSTPSGTVLEDKLSDSVILDVKNILQKPQLPNGCEVVSLAIALTYAGYPVDPIELYDIYMPKSTCANGNPWNTYVGNAKGLGLGCYAPCVVKTGNDYLADIGAEQSVTDISGMGFKYYEKLLSDGIPVIFWGNVNMNANSSIYWERYENGQKYVWHSYSHCLVMIGYTHDSYIFCDPLKGITKYSKESVEASHIIMFNQACIIT